MAVPVKKTTKARKRARRSHHALKPVAFVYCSNCSEPVRNHTECPACGTYSQQKA